MKRLSTLFLTSFLILSVLLSNVVCAAEVTDNGSTDAVVENLDPDSMVNSGSSSSGSSSGEDNGGESPEGSGSGDNGGSEESGEEVTEPSESLSEPSESPSEPSANVPEFLNTQNPVVDISQNSINAIADAIGSDVQYQFEFQYSVIADGVTYIFDTNEEELLSNDIAIVTSGNRIKAFIRYATCDIDGADYKFLSNGYSCEGVLQPSGGYTFSFEQVTKLSISYIGWAKSIHWSNYHIYNSSGLLVYESTYSPPVFYTVSFVTGFDDLVLDSVSSDGLVVPVVSYDGYDFNGWYLDEEFTLPFDLSSYEFKSDITLYAKWTPIETDLGILVHDLLEVAKGLDIIEAQLWIILVVGLLYFVYKFFRIFF